MKTAWPSVHRGIVAGLIAFTLSTPSHADQTVTGNLTVTGAATVNGATAIGGDLDVEGNNLTLGNNAGNFGVGTFYLPSGGDGARWRLTRVSAWLWEVDNAGTVTPSMRLDASNNLTLYSGGTAALTLNPAAQSLALGSATLTASGTGLTTNGALAVGGTLTAPTVAATSGSFTGGTSGLTLNAGGADQDVVLTPSGNGNVIINGNLGVGTATPGARVDVAGNVRISSTSNALLGVGNPEIPDNGSFEVFATPTSYAISGGLSSTTQALIRTYSTVAPGQNAGLYVANEVGTPGIRHGVVSVTYTPSTNAGGPANYGFLLRGVTGIANHQGGGPANAVMGLYAQGTNSSTDVTSILAGVRASASNGTSSVASLATTASAFSGSVTNTGTIVTAKGLSVENFANSGTITDTYGVYVGDITSGTQTNKPFSIYASDPDADNYFAGNVGIGTAAPSERLHVSGQIKSETSGINFATIVGATADSNVGFVMANNGGATPGQWSMRNDSATGSWVLRRDFGGGEGERLVVAPTGDVSVTGTVYFAAGGSSRAPLILQSGRVMNTPVFGAVEFNGTNLFLTTNASNPTRQTLAFAATTLAGYGITDPVVRTSDSYADPAWITSLAAGKITGTLPAGTMPAFTGDAMSSAGGTTLTLADSGATAGTYTKVTVDAKGRVTAGANLASADVTTALGYTPVNKAGDTMSGALTATALTASNGTVTGGTTGLALSAGGTNQNVSLTPSGTGNTVLGGNVGIGTSAPTAKLDVAGNANVAGNLKLAAGTTTQAPVTLQGGALLTAPVFGAVEFDGTTLYVTNNSGSPTRKPVAYSATSLSGYGITDPVALTSASYANPAWITSLAAGKLTGTLPAATMPAFTGDATSSAGGTTLTLANSGATAGTYTKVTVDAKGRVTAGANLAPADVTTALGYTPVNKAGDTMSGALTATALTATNGTVTGGTTGLTLSAGGANQSVAVVPSGTGNTVLGGNVGIGVSSPTAKLEVAVTGTGWVPNVVSFGHATGGQMKVTADSAGSAALHNRWATYNPATSRWEWTATTTTGAGLITFGTGANYEMAFDVRNSAATTSGQPVNFVRALTLREEGATVAGSLTVGGSFSASNYTASGGTVTGGTTGLTLNAGGANQNVALVPTGTGKVTTNLGDVAALSANGFAARTGSGAYAARAIVGTAGQVNVANGDGVAGNPTISLPGTLTQATTFSAALTAGAGLATTNGNVVVNRTGTGVDAEIQAHGAGANGGAILKLDAGTGGGVYSFISHQQGGVDKWYSGIHDSFSAGNWIVRDVTNSTTPIVMTAGSLSSATLKVQTTTASTSTTTGSATFGGGIGVAGTVSAKNITASSGAGLLPAGTTSGQNSIYVSGSGDAGGTSDFRPTSIQATALGANSMALRTLDVGANAQNTAGSVSMVGIRALTNLTNTGNGNGTAYSASPYVTNTGNLTWWVGYEADNGSFSSTGDVTGPMTAFRNATFGRAAATTVTAFHAQDLVKGSGIAAGFRGQVSAATGKYNLYLDGTAANLLAGQTAITNSTTSTSSTTGALTVAGGVGITGDLNIGGNFSAGNYTASGGTVTGGSSGLNLNAGGSNQNIVLTPSGSGVVRTNLGDVAALSTNGFAARTGSGAYAARAIVGTAGQINVTNGDGVAGNPTISLPSTIAQATTFSGKLAVSDTTTATSAATGSATFAGGIGVIGASWYGDGSTGVGLTINKAANADHLRFSVGGSVKSVLFVDNGDKLGVFGSDFRVVNPTASTSTTTGALTVAGGVGIAKSLYVGQQVFATATDASTSPNSGSLVVSGGIGVAGTGYFGGAVIASGGSLQSFRTGAADAALILAADSGRSKYISFQSASSRRWSLGSNSVAESGASAGSNFVLTAYDDTDAAIGSAITVARASRDVTLGSTTEATSATTGALQVAGGGSFQKSLHLGGNLNVAGNVKLAAGTTTQAPVTLQGGTLLTTPAFGAVEFDGTTLYVTNNSVSPTRKPLAYAATTLSGYGITDPVALTTGSYANPAWITSLAAGKLTGTVPAGTMPAFSGDATSSAGGTTLTLANSGATAGTYAKVTIDAKGRVTAGANLAPSDVTTALGFTPVNKAGDTMSGALTATALTATNGTITGGTTGLALSAGGTDQNVSLVPSGTGSTILGGKVGIGTSAPTTKLDVGGTGARVVVRDLSENINATFAERMSLYARSTGPDDESNEFGAKLSFRSLWGGTENEVGYIAGFNDYAWKAGMVFAVKSQGNGALPVPAVVIRESGNVGIGTTSPTTKLDVSGDMKVTGNLVVTGTLTAANSTGSTNGVVTGSTNGLALNAGGSGNQNITLNPTGSGSVVLNGNVGVGTSTPFQKFEVSGGYARISYANAPYLDFYHSTAATDLKTTRIGSRDGSLLFESINDAYTFPIERMRIAANGNVGIGAASPSSKLEVGFGDFTNANTSTVGVLVSGDATVNPGHLGYRVVLNNTSANFAGFVRGARTLGTTFVGLEIGTETNHDIRFMTNGQGDAAERLRVAANGNVGIGTSAPTAKLHVNGTARFDGPVRIAKQGDLEMGEFTQEPNQ